MPESGRRYPQILSGRWAIIGLFVLAFIAALRVGSSLVLPIVWAGMLALLLAPLVNWLTRHRVPPALAAGLVMLTLLGSVGTAVSFLAAPAASWIDRAPQTLRQAERKIRTLTRGLAQLQETAEAVEDVTQGGTQRSREAPTTTAPAGGLFAKLSGTTLAFAGALATVVFLTYFLLAMGHRFREKLDDLLAPGVRGEVSEAVSEMQQQMSRYLAVSTAINVGVGLLTWLVMTLIGMPNAALWGVLAGIMNFIPYLGALFGTKTTITGQGIFAYAMKHERQYPPSLEVLYEQKLVEAEVEPRSVHTGRPYVYVAAGERLPEKSHIGHQFIVLYDDHEMDGMYQCVMADGHGEHVPVERVREQLKARGK